MDLLAEQASSDLRVRFPYLTDRNIMTGTETVGLLLPIINRTIPDEVKDIQPPIYPDYIAECYNECDSSQLREIQLICLSGAPLDRISQIRFSGLSKEQETAIRGELAKPCSPRYVHMLPYRPYPLNWNNCAEYFVDLNAWRPVPWRQQVEIALLHGRKFSPFCALGPKISGTQPLARLCVKAFSGGIRISKTYERHFGKKRLPTCIEAVPLIFQSYCGIAITTT